MKPVNKVINLSRLVWDCLSFETESPISRDPPPPFNPGQTGMGGHPTCKSLWLSVFFVCPTPRPASSYLNLTTFFPTSRPLPRLVSPLDCFSNCFWLTRSPSPDIGLNVTTSKASHDTAPRLALIFDLAVTSHWTLLFLLTTFNLQLYFHLIIICLKKHFLIQNSVPPRQRTYLFIQLFFSPNSYSKTWQVLSTL